MTDGQHPIPSVLRDPALSPLWRVLHDRLSSGRPVTAVRLDDLDQAGRSALADLLGVDRLPRSAVQLRRLDAALGDIADVDVRAVVRHLVGPLDDRAARRAAAAADRAALWTWLREHPVVRAQPVLAGWVDGVRAVGSGDLVRTRMDLERALAVLDRLPAGGRPLPAFAEDVLHDPHALDEGTRLGGLVLRALAVLHGTAAPDSAEARRALWERMGVAEDDLSATVLVAGLRPTGDGMSPVVLRACADAGHAASLTLAQLRSPVAWTLRVSVVHVVENPSVVALALARFGARCPPLVCPAGWPSGAGIQLLRGLAAAGQELRYHGDLDGDGIRIAAYVIAKTGAVPWRMSAADYRAAAALTGPPVGRISTAPWDDELGPAMTGCGVAVVEERMSQLLLEDLAAHADSP